MNYQSVSRARFTQAQRSIPKLHQRAEDLQWIRTVRIRFADQTCEFPNVALESVHVCGEITFQGLPSVAHGVVWQ